MTSNNSSDDELPDEPPPEYFKMRRRSNTLPKDFLSSLKDKVKLHDDSFDADDEADAKVPELPPKELNHKLNKLLKERDNQPSPMITTYHVESNNNNTSISSPHHHHQKHNHLQIQQNHHLPPIRKTSVPERPKLIGSTDNLLDSLLRHATETELSCTKKQRTPLPRGSSVYETLLQEFGREEEERDFLSPLPSPNICRKLSHGSRTSGSRSFRCGIQYTQSLPSTPPSTSRRVHWSQDTHFNKYNK